MEENLNFVPLLLVLVLAFFVPLILSRLPWLPIVVGEILAGVIIGHSGFGLVQANPILEIFSNIGLAFLMFLAGMEMDFDRLFPIRRRKLAKAPANGKNTPSKAVLAQGRQTNLLQLTLLVYLATVSLAIPAGFLLNRLGLAADPWLLSFILSATSLGVLLPVLKQRSLTTTLVGQAIFLSGLLADFLTVILLTIYLITHLNGLDFQVLSVLLLFVIFFLVYRLADYFFQLRPVRLLIEELSQVTVQIKVRGAIVILMAFVVLAGALGLEVILGAFLAGMMVSLLKTPEDTDVIHKLEAFGFGFFIPVFFIGVGLNLDLRVLFAAPQNLLLLPLLFLVSFLVKGLPSLIFRRILTWRETLAAGLLLNTHLSLEIAVAVIGARLELITPAANTVVILFAVLTVFTLPVLFNTVLPPYGRKEPPWMVIFGAEDFGIQVAQVLAKHGERVCFLDPNPRLIEKARQAGYQAMQGDIPTSSMEVLTQGGIQTLLALSAEDARNLLVCQAASSLGVEHMVALLNNPARLTDYRASGVKVFAPALYRPTLLALMARSPDVFTLLTSTTDEQDVREVTLRNPDFSGIPLRTLGIPGSLLVLSIGRGGELLVPHGNTRLEVGDHLTILGNIEDIRMARVWLENGTPV